MNIEIPFNDWSKERLMDQSKKATSRNKKYGKVGDNFIVYKPKNHPDKYTLIAVYEIELIIEIPLWFVAEDLYRSEGAESKEEFVKVWEEIHPRKGYRPFDLVWYHHFKEK